MKFYSEKLNTLYDTQDALVKAEKAHDEKIAAEKAAKAKAESARASRAKEVEAAYKAMAAAQKEYRSKLAAFTKDYGSFHMTLHDEDCDALTIEDLFDLIFK